MKDKDYPDDFKKEQEQKAKDLFKKRPAKEDDKTKDKD